MLQGSSLSLLQTAAFEVLAMAVAEIAGQEIHLSSMGLVEPELVVQEGPKEVAAVEAAFVGLALILIGLFVQKSQE